MGLDDSRQGLLLINNFSPLILGGAGLAVALISLVFILPQRGSVFSSLLLRNHDERDLH